MTATQKNKNRKPISPSVLRELWARSAGRCAICNKVLWRDARTKSSGNRGHIAHIVAAEPKGARGDSIRSAQLCTDYANLMLACYDCHDEIDSLETRDNYPEERLLLMKQSHEARIERLTGIQQDKASDILLFGANIGDHAAPIQVRDCYQAVTPDFYPANANPIILSFINSSICDDQNDYWQFETKNLENQFRQKVQERVQLGELPHLSVFALAPQPLLIRLGALLGELKSVVVYQPHREPKTWRWREPQQSVSFQIHRPERHSSVVALNLSLSATITNDRIHAIVGTDCAIWMLTHEQPHPDFLRTAGQLADFRNIVRQLLNEVKARHGQTATLHVFPAMPASMAVELGRVRMPKADLPFMLYDQNNHSNGFTRALIIN